MRTYTGRTWQDTTLVAADGTTQRLPIGTRVDADETACDAEEDQMVTVSTNYGIGSVLRWHLSF